MRTVFLLAVASVASTARARDDGLFRVASVTEIQNLYGNSCPQRLEQCQAALVTAHNDDGSNTEIPSLDFLHNMAENPAVWSQIRKLRHLATNLEQWTPDRLNLSLRKLLRLAHALSQCLEENWNVSLSTPVNVLERLVTTHPPDAFLVATYLHSFLLDVTKTILTAALVPDADVECELQAWTCQYQRMLATVLPPGERTAEAAL
ncbi:hypothetical protein FisN_7Lh254 [Fistulifera solaris]|uniref:Uncharacterized protein n=1 Tax=Fistulifera solaris TaxID=1519565 RepID=A0A1Z5JRQ2_FISSO|nr:hypothetical protein FisN_7Lh254 [Fistulifera solaris]|eukprot:GAX16532.1 hypothetical protein FisN_7Lh254 [Fistulifera solaris]